MNKNEARQYQSLVMSEAHKIKKNDGRQRLAKGDVEKAAQAVIDSLGLDMSGKELLRLFSPRFDNDTAQKPLSLFDSVQKTPQTPEQILQAMEKRHAEEIQQAREEIAKILKSQEEEARKRKRSNGLWVGDYVYVYLEKRAPQPYRIRSRKMGSITTFQISAFDDVEQTTKLAQEIDRIIKQTIENATRDAASA
jgi:antitoxin component of RelBE/YafQ-DinJ toxin-antitoxin module